MKPAGKIFVAIIISTLTFFGCKEDRIPAPENLITQEKMVDVLYDMYILESAQSYIKYDRDSLFHQITMEQFTEQFYAKHGVNKEVIISSNHYYAAKPKLYDKIHQRVMAKLNERLAEEQALADSLKKDSGDIREVLD